MTIAAPAEKLEEFRTSLAAWPSDRAAASEKEPRGLMGKLALLYGGQDRKILRATCVVVAGVGVGAQTNKFVRGAGTRQIPLGVEFHADSAFWRLLIEGRLGSVRGAGYLHP